MYPLFLQVTQDVPRYMMVAGNRAELRGLNFEGLQRHGFSSEEVGTILDCSVICYVAKQLSVKPLWKK